MYLIEPEPIRRRLPLREVSPFLLVGGLDAHRRRRSLPGRARPSDRYIGARCPLQLGEVRSSAARDRRVMFPQATGADHAMRAKLRAVACLLRAPPKQPRSAQPEHHLVRPEFRILPKLCLGCAGRNCLRSVAGLDSTILYAPSKSARQAGRQDPSDGRRSRSLRE